jgi:deoxycytidylate deaminase
MKNERLTFDEYGCLLALMAKSRSEDPFTKVGGVALDINGRVLGASYNGLKSGQKMPEWMNRDENRERKSDLFIHCESNLCAQLRKGECYTICLTLSPCIKCCQSISVLDIRRVVYLQEYSKCVKFKDFLSFHDIEFLKLSKKGKNKISNYLLSEEVKSLL